MALAVAPSGACVAVSWPRPALQSFTLTPHASRLTPPCASHLTRRARAQALAEMIALIEEGVISGKIAKDALPRLLAGEGNGGVRAFVESQGLVQISGARRSSTAAYVPAHCPHRRSRLPGLRACGSMVAVLSLCCNTARLPGRLAGMSPPPHPPADQRPPATLRRRRVCRGGDGGRGACGQPQAACGLCGRQDQAGGLFHWPGGLALRIVLFELSHCQGFWWSVRALLGARPSWRASSPARWDSGRIAGSFGKRRRRPGSARVQRRP